MSTHQSSDIRGASVASAITPEEEFRHSRSVPILSRPNRDEVQRRPTINLEAAELAAQNLLTALGANLGADGLRETPRRIARAYAEMLTPTPFNMTTFPNEEGYDELVAVRGIPFQSLCMHHMLPFHRIAHVAYLPNEHIVGLSKLGRVVDLFARDLSSKRGLRLRSPTGWMRDWPLRG